MVLGFRILRYIFLERNSSIHKMSESLKQTQGKRREIETERGRRERSKENVSQASRQ